MCEHLENYFLYRFFGVYLELMILKLVVGQVSSLLLGLSSGLSTIQLRSPFLGLSQYIPIILPFFFNPFNKLKPKNTKVHKHIDT